MSKEKKSLLVGVFTLISFVVVVIMISWVLKSFSPHNSDEFYRELTNTVNNKEERIRVLELQSLNLSLELTEIKIKFDKINRSLKKNFDKIIIDTSEFTMFSNLKSQIDISNNQVETQLNEIRNIKYSLEEFVKNYPEGQLYADKITSLEKKVDLQYVTSNKRDVDFRNNIEKRLELWSKSFDLYSVILSIVATALIGLIGVVFIYIRKIGD